MEPRDVSSESPATDGTFSGLTNPLSEDLELIKVDIDGGGTRNLLKASDDDAKKQFLPGQPRIRLNAADHDHDELLDYLRTNHLTKPLDDLLPFMRYIFVQTPSFKHIMPLHHQKAHSREVKVNENPGLHLVWYYERIFIKPIPAYFYSKTFWVYLKDADPKVYEAAVGFMRSYYYLIQYQIDFDEACEHKLIPKKPDGKHPTYEEFCNFIHPFTLVNDNHVSRRFHYGELRLTRINRTALLFKGHLAYFHIHLQWGSFLTHILAPLIAVFAVFSVVLNSMQVSLAALSMTPGSQNAPFEPAPAWFSFISVSIYFPVVIIIVVAVVIGVGLLGMSAMGAKDLVHGNNVRRRKKRGDLNTDEKSHGIVW